MGELVLLLQHEWDDHPSLMTEANMVDHIIVFPGTRGRNGLYAPTHSVESLTPRGLDNNTLSTDQQVRFRTEFLARYVKLRALPNDLTQREQSDFILGKPVIRVTHHPLGYLHNTLSLTMFAMLCWSLRLNIPKLWRRRIDPTKCPHCRYSTIGLTTNTCPECGKPIT